MSRFAHLTLACLAVASLTLLGCGNDNATKESNADSKTPAWVLTSAPGEAQSVADAKVSAKEGDTIVLSGRIGGRKEPLTSGSPVFIVMDLAIPHCGDNPDDACRTPWDYCCETPAVIIANSATIQIVDQTGKPVSESPDAHGLAALDKVIIVGTVGPRPNADILTVQATGIYHDGR